MEKLDVNKFLDVQGGAFISMGPAMGPVIRFGNAGVVGIGTFNAGAAAVEAMVSHVDKLNQIGARAGEAAFNATHPNPLGQMVFEK